MILSVKGTVKGIFILTPYYMEPNPQDWMRKRMDEYGAICKKLAVKHGCCLVDLQEVFNRYFEYRHSSYIAWDRVHPNLIGATVIAKAFLSLCISHAHFCTGIHTLHYYSPDPRFVQAKNL